MSLPYVEQLFQCALKALREDLALNPGRPDLIREVCITNQRLAQVFGSDYRKEALAEILKQLMTWRSVSSQCGGICCSYKHMCTAFEYTKDGVIIHMYPQAISFLDEE